MGRRRWRRGISFYATVYPNGDWQVTWTAESGAQRWASGHAEPEGTSGTPFQDAEREARRYIEEMLGRDERPRRFTVRA